MLVLTLWVLSKVFCSLLLKFMKIYLSILVGLMLVFGVALAAADDAILQGEAQFILDGTTIVVNGSQFTLDTLTVNDDGSLSFTIGADRSIAFKSTSRKVFNLDSSSNLSITRGCSSSESTVSITSQASAAITRKITMGGTCTSDSGGGGGGGGGGSSGGGGGGGGSSAPPASVPVATPKAPEVAKPSPVAQLVSPVFNKDLERGHRGDDVKRLQELLRQDKEIYPEGVANGFFGPATQNAIRRFQKKYGLPQVGRVGPGTRAKLAEVFGGKAAPAPIPAPAPVPVVAPSAPAASALFNKDLSRGNESDDVKNLQGLLAKDKEIYPEGVANGFFGPATEKAVKRFQAKHGLPQVGRVGPATRAKLNELSGGKPVSTPAPQANPSAASQQQQLSDLLKKLQDLQGQLKKP